MMQTEDKYNNYCAVIFTSAQTKSLSGYTKMAGKIEVPAKLETGFLGFDSARNEIGITVSYWKNLEAIKKWKQQTDHLIVQNKGKNDW